MNLSIHFLRVAAIAVCSISGLASTHAVAREFPTIVELYTSQGCSSCPSADAYLLEMLPLQEAENFIILGFHVDYWDYLGWKDTFGKAEYTDRQRGYMVAMGLQSVYTPQMIVGGLYDVVGSDRNSVKQFIAAEKTARLEGRPKDMTFLLQEDGLYLRVEKGDFEGVAQVWLVMYRPVVDVPIFRGENAGRTITYGNVVHSVELLGEWKGAFADFAIPESTYVKCEGPIPDSNDSGLGCVALLQVQGFGAILAAAQLTAPANP